MRTNTNSEHGESSWEHVRKCICSWLVNLEGNPSCTMKQKCTTVVVLQVVECSCTQTMGTLQAGAQTKFGTQTNNCLKSFQRVNYIQDFHGVVKGGPFFFSFFFLNVYFPLVQTQLKPQDLNWRSTGRWCGRQAPCYVWPTGTEAKAGRLLTRRRG